MSQKFERRVLQRTYTYDNGDYVLALDIGKASVDCDLGFDKGHLHVTVFHPNGEMVGEFSVPIRERIKDKPTYQYKNGIITLEAKLDNETDSNNFNTESVTDTEQEEVREKVEEDVEKSESASEDVKDDREPASEEADTDEVEEQDSDEDVEE
jgi:gas vesicle protein